QRATEPDEVGLAAGDDRLGLLRRLDPSAGDDGKPSGRRLDADVLLDEGRWRRVAIGQMAVDGVEVALAQRQIIDEAVGGELAGDPRAVVDREAARRELVRPHAVADDEAPHALLPDAG